MSTALLSQMTSVLGHRGPDDHDTRIIENAGLGHRRLAIVDRSAAGRQPMCDESETLWVVFNGEIYNHLELRARLEREGFHFRSRSDTEVILYLYRLYGDDCVHHLRGMFAFAIWDASARRLMVARDRFGQKPIYYAETDGRFMFASELKALRQCPELCLDINLSSIHRYLAMDYIAAPNSIYKSVRKLPAAHQLTLEDGRLAVKRYWSLDYSQPEIAGSRMEREQQLREHFDEAVRLRLMGEVPMGVFLSGGVDSNLIAATMSRVGDQRVESFTIGFSNQCWDESRHAAEAAEYLGTKHHEFILQPDLQRLLPTIACHFDEPFGDPSALPTWCLSEMASRHITVALTGEGGDEALAGYPRYRKHGIARRIWMLPGPVRRGMSRLLTAMLPDSTSLSHPLRGLANLLGSQQKSLDPVYAQWLFHCDLQTAESLYCDEFSQSLTLNDPLDYLSALFAGSNARTPLDAMLHVDQQSYLADDLLPKLDMTMMAHGMEGRSPFLDHEFAAFMAALPEKDKLHGSCGKRILRDAMADRVGPGVMDREKRGFGLPLQDWLNGSLRDMLHDVLFSTAARSRGLFRPPALQTLIRENEQGHPTRAFLLWNLLILELWFANQDDQRVDHISLR